PYEVLEALKLFFQDLNFDLADVECFGCKVLQFLTSSDERRFGEYESLSWWSFIEGGRYAPPFQRQLRGVPRTMVAMEPHPGSARTIGTILMQLFLDFASTGVTNDRTMGGPTSPMWIDHWVAYLKTLGVQHHMGQRCASLDVVDERIDGVRLVGASQTLTADHYVLAVPIDVAPGLISPQMGALDPALEAFRLADLDTLVAWMVGIQFFLYEDVQLVRGHTFYPDSPWALASISQPQ